MGEDGTQHELGLIGVSRWGTGLGKAMLDSYHSMRFTDAADIQDYGDKRQQLWNIGSPDYYSIDPEEPESTEWEEFYEGLDAVYIASPVNTHEEYVRRSLEMMDSGAVIAEKAPAASIDGMNKIEREADRSNADFFTTLHYVHKPVTRLMGKYAPQLESGHGSVKSVDFVMMEDSSEQEDDEREHIFTPPNGTLMLDMGSHGLECLRHATGASFDYQEGSTDAVENYDWLDYPSVARAEFDIGGGHYSDDAVANLWVGKGCSGTVKEARFGFEDGTEAVFRYQNDREDPDRAVIVDGENVENGMNKPRCQKETVGEIRTVLDGGSPELDREDIRMILEPVLNAAEEMEVSGTRKRVEEAKA